MSHAEITKLRVKITGLRQTLDRQERLKRQMLVMLLDHETETTRLEILLQAATSELEKLAKQPAEVTP